MIQAGATKNKKCYSIILQLIKCKAGNEETIWETPAQMSGKH
jgi:hypothetical protein